MVTHRETLKRLIDPEMRVADFSDDHLGDGLGYLSPGRPDWLLEEDKKIRLDSELSYLFLLPGIFANDNP